jgi:glycosyltransferase involved in cell wall biosynthesis
MRVLAEERKDSPPFRVLLVSEPGVDGVFRYVEALAHYLCARGINTDLAYSSFRSGPALHELVQFIETRGGKTLDLRTGNWPGWTDIPAFDALLRFVRHRRPDVVHAHSSKAGALVRALRFRGIKLPLFYTPHAYYGMSRPNRRRSPSPFFFDVVEAFLSRIGQTINVSKTEADYAHTRLRLPRERQITIPNGIDYARFCPPTATAREEIRSTLGIPRDALVLGTVARYCHQKDPLTLHRAVRLALERHPQLWFVHVGCGQPLWNEVDALGRHERICRLPSFDPMDRFYKALNGFILASRYEGLSLSAVEALATNLPLILTQVVGNLDFRSMGLNTVFWAPANDVEALASAIDLWASAHPHSPNHRELTYRLFRDETIHTRILNEYFSAAGFSMDVSRPADLQTISCLIETQAQIP